MRRNNSRMFLTSILFILAIALGPRPSLSNKPFVGLQEANCIGMPDRIICTCNETRCDELKFDWPTVSGQARLVETTKSGLRFQSRDLTTTPSGGHESAKSLSIVSVDTTREGQTILGFGGSFTDAATINIQSLSKTLADKLIESYYGLNGLQYTLGRVPIGGSDFSTRAYSYDDADFNDYNLTEWKLAPEDLEYKLPVIKRARELVESTGQENRLNLIASPWSPPAWMKTNKDLKRGHLIADDKIYDAYAKYLVKFYLAYKSHGIDFWGATLQNEPVMANLPLYFFNSLQMTTEEANRFIVDHLGPALESQGYTKDNFKLIVGDDSLHVVNKQVTSLLDDEQVRKYVSGFAFHWYLSGSVVPFSSLSKLVDSAKGKADYVIMSEACNGGLVIWKKHVELGDWSRGESYAVDIIEDMNRGTNAWIDWNLALDEQGGPNWAKNYVDSAIIVNKTKNEFYKQPMYYVLAHFARFFRPNSIQIASQLEDPAFFEPILILAAHIKQTNHVVINILNKSNNVRELNLKVKGPSEKLYEFKSISVEGRSINTVVLKL